MTAPSKRSLVIERVYERNTFLVNADGAGHVAMTIPVSPAGLLLATRLAGYRALRDQMRIDRVVVTLHPINGTDTEGQVGVYVERDPTAAVVGSVPLVADQFESVVGQAFKTISLEWLPQQPTDREYLLLNPGTDVLSNIYVYGASFPASLATYNVTVESWTSLRGRP